MLHRECPFCGRSAEHPRVFGERRGAVYLRCQSCGAVYMDISPHDFRRLHDVSFADEGFLDDKTAMRGGAPDRQRWEEFSALLGPGSVLEIGPGTGQVLAAARDDGREVAGIESSETHRDFIRRSWAIEELYASLDEVPAGRRFDNVIMVNVLEHVYDVAGLMSGLREHLTNEARIFISTVNARGILGTLAGTYWSMFKPLDHVSFPSLESLRVLASRTGYRLERRWSAELPLETPLGLLVAVRDYLRDSRGQSAPESAGTPAGATGRSARKRLLSRVYDAARHLDPSRHAVARLQRAATVKGVFVPAA
ncbi:MAG TPA: methyltransferase domain-containing protein [Polyangiales bacterium]|nr:methyltransferase domain-containing protein [Polyangiales bacterium]